eukprot:GHVQ01004863.1.p1 GENE.GHVQ01004863.1~~GHVQ01004863.1.p1  ORF type:complete len:1054 (+),score=108.54 GHVQ01004863.1:196-3357(+)
MGCKCSTSRASRRTIGPSIKVADGSAEVPRLSGKRSESPVRLADVEPEPKRVAAAHSTSRAASSEKRMVAVEAVPANPESISKKVEPSSIVSDIPVTPAHPQGSSLRGSTGNYAETSSGLAFGAVVSSIARGRPPPSYCDIFSNQADILPPHLRHSDSVSEILLESSVMGKYIMLPWNEKDKDIEHNFWYNVPPPRTALPVATHSQAPPNSLASPFSSPKHPHSSTAHIDLQNSVCGDEVQNDCTLGMVGAWVDPDGPLSLSQKQRQKFHAWKRITELHLDSVVFQDRPSSKCIRQGFVGDCSFLCSLAVLAEFEARHQIPVLSGIIYPQVPHPTDRNRVMAVVNPAGMYGCRLYFNGVPRKVLVDDFVPIRKDNKILSAHSSNRRELWVTLLEKSFVKLMGGSYFMQGSNPGADLYHLTGWIPETIPFRSDIHTGSPDTHQPIVTGGTEETSFLSDPKWVTLWNLLHSGLCDGRCVACLGTSEVADAAPSGLDFPEGVSISSGIVARHAYSILAYREVFGLRLVYIKNPWGSIRWKGRFSPDNHESWTPQLSACLNYDSKRQSQTDNGCFWIEWEDVVKWFSHLYICWNNTCFPYQKEIHSKWDRSRLVECSCLADDSHLVAYNPQFHLQIQLPSSESLTDQANSLEDMEIWILLSRHVRERKRDLSQKYLAVHVHTGYERVTCPPPPAKQGVYSNGECTLVKLVVGGNTSDALHTLDYVLVVSQYSQKDEFNFTLKVYSHVNTSLRQLPPLVPRGWQSWYLKGQWTSSTAGGCSNDLWSFLTNPHIRLVMPQSADVALFLECPQEHSVNLRIFKGRVATARLLRTGRALSSGPYRAGCCVTRTHLKRGVYTLVASTFRPSELGEFQLCLHTPPEAETPLLLALPYPHAIPPLPGFCYKTIQCGGQGVPLSEKILVSAERPTMVSVRVQIFYIEPGDALPSLTMYRQRVLEDCDNPQYSSDALRVIEDIVVRSDLEGGLREDGRRSSSAAHDLYQRQGVINISLVELESSCYPYILHMSNTLGDATCGAFQAHFVSDGPLRISLFAADSIGM